MYWDWARAEIGAMIAAARTSAATGAVLHRALRLASEILILFHLSFFDYDWRSIARRERRNNQWHNKVSSDGTA
jgi:hypothetical protein